jgi:hypothetical protein
VGRLREFGMDITVEEILEQAGQGPGTAEATGKAVGRPHLAAVMLRKGYVDSIQQAFDDWLATGRPAYLGRDRLDPEEAITLAHESGALAVLAHPSSLGLDPMATEDFVRHLARLGLDGVECEYGRFTPDQRAWYRALAGRLGLCVTGGSDYHGTYKPDLSIGTGTGDLGVVDELLAALEDRLAAVR